MVISQKEEAIKILEILEKYFPKRFDGKEAILWLHKHTTQRRQEEWAAFFFEEYCFPLLTNFMGGWKGPRITKDKRFDYQREYVWDLKLESNFDKNGKPSDWIILNDKDATNRIINIEAGIGFIIANVDFSFDMNGKLRKWRMALEKNPKKRTGPGKTRILKTDGKITNLKAVIIKDRKQIERGINEKWMGDFYQGRNSDGSPRQPKYKLNLKKIPSEYVITLI